MSKAPRSTRQPWVRTGLMGLVPLLLPFVWVLELDSCGHAPVQTELTGTMVIGKFELEGWAVALPVLLVLVLTPYLAARVAKPGLRVLVHVLGLIAALFAAWGAFFVMLFAIFSERVFYGVGWVVLGSFVGSIVDAVLRVIWSTLEWLRARAAAKAG